MSPQHILSEKLVVLIPSCLIVELSLAKLQIDVTRLEIRDVIDTITSKVVLILDHFMSERKAILDTLRDELSKYDFLPVLFDFEKPHSRDFTETVRTLAYLARFIIADLTDKLKKATFAQKMLLFL